MGKKGSTTVTPPDPYEIARADAQYNRIDQYTPAGNLQYLGPERNIAQLTLSPQVQQLFNSQTQADQQALNLALGRLAGFESELPPLSEGLSANIDNPNSHLYRDRVEQSLYDRGAGLLEDTYGRREDDLRQDLANRGLLGAGTQEITEGAFNELDLLGEQRGEAFNKLALDSVLAGGQEQDRLLNASIGTELTNAQMVDANRARQFNELAALLGLQQVAQPGLSNFFAPSQADVTGAFALNNQANMANAQNATSQRNALLGALGGLGEAWIGA